MHTLTTEHASSADVEALIPTQVANPSAKKPRTRSESVGGQQVAGPATKSKTDLVLKLLRSKKGATVAQICAAMGWQAHSVRGFLSGTVRKKLALPLVSDVGKDGERHYRIGPPSEASM